MDSVWTGTAPGAEWDSAMTLNIATFFTLASRGNGPFEGSRDVKGSGFAEGWLVGAPRACSRGPAPARGLLSRGDSDSRGGGPQAARRSSWAR